MRTYRSLRSYRVVIYAGDTPDETTSKAIPEEYRRHGKVFSKTSSQQLPKPTIWDHAIKLLPGAPATLPECLLPLNQIEKDEIHKFVQDHLKQGTVQVSKSLYVANFFFVKKKDGKLQPVQDY
jgi:hypothetical protein